MLRVKLVLGKSPHKLVYGREVQLPADLATMSTDP